MELLPLRMTAQLAEACRELSPTVAVSQPDPALAPVVTGVLPRPIEKDTSLVFRVHAQNGIPLASARVPMTRGTVAFDSGPLVFLGMEGYAHLPPADRRAIENRIWLRRAFVTVSLGANADRSPVTSAGANVSC